MNTRCAFSSGIGPRGKFHAAWHDLDEAGRREAFEAASRLRRPEALLDPERLSSTAHAALGRIRGDR